MARYRKKPVVIEAIQYQPGGRIGEAPPEEMLRHLAGCKGWHMADTPEPAIVIPTLEGDHLAKAGDWIVKGVQGEFYPVKPSIFEETYEEA